MKPGWKIVQVTMLVRDHEAAELASTYGRFTEHDELSKGAYVQARDLTPDDEDAFDDIIDDYEEDEV